MQKTLADRHNQFHSEFRQTFMFSFFMTGAAIGVALFLSGSLEWIETAIFPWDAISILSMSLVAIASQRFGYHAQANNWFILGFIWAIAFNMPHYGVNHPVTALYLPLIVLSGLLVGRIFQTTMVVLCSMFIPVFAALEFTGRRSPPIAVQDERELIGTILFWLGIMITTGWLVRIFANKLEQAVATSRGQALALANTRALLHEDLDLDTLYIHVLETVSRQLQVQEATLFLHNESDDTLIGKVYYKNGCAVERADIDEPTPNRPSQEVPLWIALRENPQIIHMTDIANDPRIRFRVHLLEQGIRSVLVIPILLEKRVIGMVTLNSHSKLRYLPEELEIAQTLVAQLALGIQLSRLSQATHETAIIRERNRMARDIHDTLAQGFTGVIVQLEAAEDVLDTKPEQALPHLQQARQLARDSLKEARRSVMAIRPYALHDRTLPEALQTLIGQMSSPNTPAITLRVEGSYRPLTQQIEDHLLRITQEAVTNALKYAQARTIGLHLIFDRQTLQLQITDDGIGFVVDARHDGLGLIGIRERAMLMKAQIHVDSTIGQGTKISVRLNHA